MDKATTLMDRWIPVLGAAGSTLISPWQIAEDGGLRYRKFAAPRPDFNATLVQFLIGLLQTAFAPEDDRVWERYWKVPPEPDVLRAAFDSLGDVFRVDGDGARFMQDFNLPDGETKPVAALLMDAPGGNTIRNNQDHFVKRGAVAAVCPYCAATALLTLQINAPSGGQGHRVGLRGGGPLSTLVMPRDVETGALGLWHLLWINVLPRDRFTAAAGMDGAAAIFPWLAPTRTSETNQKVTPMQAHPLQMFWAMPRRIRLDLEGAAGTCDLCGSTVDRMVRSFRTRNFGASYEGWCHVLSPHTQDETGLRLPLHGQPGGVGYRHWAGIVLGDRQGRLPRAPARVVADWQTSQQKRAVEAGLWCFGYDMDNMKARAWLDSRMPLLLADEDHRERFEPAARALVAAAEEAVGYLRMMVKGALFGDVEAQGGNCKWSFPPNASTEGTLFDSLSAQFWRDSETQFFAHLRRLAAAAAGDDQAAMRTEAESWLGDLAKRVEALFDQQVGLVEEAEARIKAVVFARTQLKRMCRGDKIKAVLGLITVQAQTKGKARKGGKRG